MCHILGAYVSSAGHLLRITPRHTAALLAYPQHFSAFLRVTLLSITAFSLDLKYLCRMANSSSPRPSSTASARRPTDEVDAILSAWALERPDVDTTPMQVLSRVGRLSRHLDLERRKAFAAHNLDTWEFDVLSSLRREGEPYALTPGALMTELLVSSGTMTNRIDRLESAGLVTRTPSPHDRRAVVVSLTDEGKRRVDAALMSLLECERAILAPLNIPEKEQLATLLRSLLLAFEQ